MYGNMHIDTTDRLLQLHSAFVTLSDKIYRERQMLLGSTAVFTSLILIHLS